VTKTTVVNYRRGERYDVYIGRSKKMPRGRWGNPFVVGIDGTPEECIALFEQRLMTQPDLLTDLHTLKGKRLGCTCKPKPCHGDVLARLADALLGEAKEAE
jgi:hypothetical protein